MNEPIWVRKQMREVTAKQERLRKQAQEEAAIHFEVARPRGLEDVGMFFTLGENAAYPRDEQVTKAIWSFDPWVVPMWVNWVFKDLISSKEVVFGRHAVGVHNPNLKLDGPHQFDHLEIPPGYTGKIPNRLILIHEGEREPGKMSLPGPYLPWDWNLYKKLKDCFIEFKSLDEAKKELLARKLQEERDLASARGERARIYRDLDDYAARQLAQMSEVEMKEFALHGRKQWRRDPKTMLFLKGD